MNETTQRRWRGFEASFACALAITAAACSSASAPAAATPPMAAGGGATPVPTATPTPTPTPSPSAEPSPTSATTPSAPEVVRSARIRGANGHAASGTARILRSGGRYTLELGSDFRIDSGSNDVYLTRNSAMPADGDINLGNMQATTGSQSYDMGNNGAAGHGFVLLWCRPFRIPIAVGELQ